MVGEDGRSVCAYTYDSGLEAARALLNGDPPDAVFCANDLIALGFIDGVRAAGWRVPDDIAVVGFDDIPMSDWLGYKLTTVRLPTEEMIEQTIRRLL